ncbi:hypothetical protein CQW23_02184 [Capsicum baccatum]|uniref:Uncharacterized protein n=1 Tax=Capsicum baccatum TaxID=33114 RepID=A0A2G2XR39_CAPBA|nr:hypothetical protein CQW23_02184 [Capsicum baccatum]
MVLEISVVDLKKEDPKKEYNDTKWIYDPYNVYVDEQRILTIVTNNHKTVTKWFNELQKTPSNNKHGCIFVTICVERDPYMVSSYHYDEPNRDRTPYSLLSVCTGSQCLLYRLPFANKSKYRYDDDPIPKALKAFFADPRVMVIGRKIRGVMKRLDEDFDIKFANPVDINILADVGLERDELDLRNYDLNRLSMTVLGKHWDVIWPEKPIEWFPVGGRWWSEKMNPEKVKYATVEPYVCFMVSAEILDGMDGSWYPRPLDDFLFKYEKKKSKSKNKCKKKF